MHTLFEAYMNFTHNILPFFMISWDTGWYFMQQERRHITNWYAGWVSSDEWFPRKDKK